MEIKIYADLHEAELIRISRQEFKDLHRHLSMIDFHLDILDQKLNLNGAMSRKLRETYLNEIKKNNAK